MLTVARLYTVALPITQAPPVQTFTLVGEPRSIKLPKRKLKEA